MERRANGALVIGRRLGPWELTGLLGHGNQGTVYEARHVRERRGAAVKVLLKHASRDGAAVQRFFDEARAAAAIRHEGVVQIFDHGRESDGVAWVAMERLYGETLFDRLRRKLLSADETVAVTRELARTLTALHPALVHRDLKPENIFLEPGSEQARVVLVDFGIARLPASPGTLSGAGAIGSPPYMAPEQCRGEPGDHRVDLYALGCLICEMVCGTPPFGFSGGAQLLHAHQHQAPPPLHEVAEGVPPPLAALAAALLEKDPAARPASAVDVLATLEAAGLGGKIEAPRVAPAQPPGWRERVWNGVLGTPPWTAAALTCLLGSGLAGLAIVLGVGSDYLRAPNWGFTYAVLVPLAVMLMLEFAQRSGVDRRTGSWLVGLGSVLAPLTVGSSLVELHHRAGLPGTWWTESPLMGSLGAVVQGLLITLINLFVVNVAAWTAHARARPEESTGAVQPMLWCGGVIQLIDYLSHAQHTAGLRGESMLDAMLAGQAAKLLDLGTGHYASGIVVVGSCVVTVFLCVALLAVRSHVRVHGPIAVLVALSLANILVPLGPIVAAALLVFGVVRATSGAALLRPRTWKDRR